MTPTTTRHTEKSPNFPRGASKKIVAAIATTNGAIPRAIGYVVLKSARPYALIKVRE
jgi:hypothetical protein